MLFATYQPVDEAKRDVYRYPDLTMHLGYDPIFCFPANTAREAILYSLITNTSEHPEKFIIFEADEWDELDIVQWSKKTAIDYQIEQDRLRNGRSGKTEMAVSECFTDKDRLYKICMVKEIKNIIVSMDIKEMLFLEIETANSEWRGFLGEVIKSAQQCALSICKNVNPPVAAETSWDDYAPMAHQMIKEGFQSLMLPLLYPITLEKPISFSTYFNYQDYLNRMTLNKISKLTSIDEDLGYKTYDYFNSIAKDIRDCTTKTYDRMLSDGFNNSDTKLGPNSMCPCGSGKKYKKCCSRTTLEGL